MGKILRAMDGLLGVWLVSALATIILTMSGCKEPSTIGRYRATPVTNIILDDLGVVDEQPETFSGARQPMPRDLRVASEEYVIQKGDIIRVRVFELFGLGLQWEDNIQVNDTGRITLPVIGTMVAENRTELELTEDVVNRLSPQIIKDPKVGVVVLQSVQKVFTVQGAINAPGPYQLTEADFRIMRALAMAGGVPQFGSDYAYVIRNLDIEETINGDISYDTGTQAWQDSGLTPPQAEQDFDSQPPAVVPQPVKPPNAQDELLESITPMALMSSQSDGDLDGATASLDIIEQLELAERQRQQEQAGDVEPEITSRVVREGGRWQLEGHSDQPDDWTEPFTYDPAGNLPAPPIPPAGMEDDWDFDDFSGAGQQQEVIRVDLKKLTSGDITQNIVIRPGDDIHVPPNAIGIFYVAGQVSRPGPYNINGGQRMTLRQAVIGTAGPLTPTAWPSRCEITRRIGENQEVTARFDLQKVMEGTAPDMYIKPGDVLNIGSHPMARFIAVVRQSFRATYGFGFVYDRNLADKDFGH